MDLLNNLLNLNLSPWQEFIGMVGLTFMIGGVIYAPTACTKGRSYVFPIGGRALVICPTVVVCAGMWVGGLLLFQAACFQ